MLQFLSSCRKRGDRGAVLERLVGQGVRGTVVGAIGMIKGTFKTSVLYVLVALSIAGEIWGLI
jgi:hypothetical protein